MDLAGKRVVITGAGGALGRAVAERAAQYGAHCILVDLAFPPGAPAGERYVVDLSDRDATATSLAAIGPVDALFNVAGGFAMGENAWEADADVWDSMFTINVRTLQNAVRAVVPGMLERGRGAIVNVGALGAQKGLAQMSSYCAAKSTVMRLTESLSAELRERGINVNAVLPSLIDTPRNRGDMPGADHSRWVRPEDLANVICFLGSDAARAVHGALVPVTGLV